LYEQIRNEDGLEPRINLIEEFFLARYLPPSKSETEIFTIAEQLQDNPSNTGIQAARQQVPLSTRQIERSFKALTGVAMQAFIRISRFARAKQLLHKNPSLRLTDIGLKAGYYDQSHFSKDFKEFSGVSPRRFEHCIQP
jgi:transcriptional regulator GlxA family with amidase domain